MKVLMVGNIYGWDAGANFYMIMQKLVHGFARNGHAVQPFNDRETARAATPFRTRKLGVKTANRRLLEHCRNYRPDFVLLGHCEMITNETLNAIRDAVPGVCIAYRNVDPIFDVSNRRHIHNRTESVDAIFLTTAGEGLRDFAGGHARVYYMPNPVDPAVETLRQFERNSAELPTDLFFGISGMIRGGDNRIQMARALQQRLSNITFEVRGLDYPAVRGAAYFDCLARARMGLNFSRINSHYLYSSDRMAQYTGCGLLTFIDRATGFSDLFAEDELAFYNDFEDLVEQVEHYTRVDAARRRVAEKGWSRARRVFDCGRVAKYIEEASLGRAFTADYDWPTHPARPETVPA